MRAVVRGWLGLGASLVAGMNERNREKGRIECGDFEGCDDARYFQHIYDQELSKAWRWRQVWEGPKPRSYQINLA